MEKFAVDLDKVLDEFEFNEDRAEQLATEKDANPVATPAIGDMVLNHQTSPAQYHHPAFEPINLADTDFTAGPQLFNNNEDTDNTNAPLNSNIYPPHPDISSHANDTSGHCLNSDPTWQLQNQSERWDSHNANYPQIVDRGWQHNVIMQDRNSIGTKLNVSGVFSSLKEYINAGVPIEHHEENGNFRMEHTSNSIYPTIDTATDAVIELQNEKTEDDKNHNFRWKKPEVNSSNMNGSFADVIPTVYSRPQQSTSEKLDSTVKTTSDETPDLLDSTLSNLKNDISGSTTACTHDEGDSIGNRSISHSDILCGIPLPDVTTSGSLVLQNAGVSDTTFDLVTSHNTAVEADSDGVGSSALDLISHKDDSFEDASPFQDCSELKESCEAANASSSTFTEVSGNSSFGSSKALQTSDLSALTEDISTPDQSTSSPVSGFKLKPAPVGFSTLENLSDSELHQYLQELDDDDDDDDDDDNGDNNYDENEGKGIVLQNGTFANKHTAEFMSGSNNIEIAPKVTTAGLRTSGGSMRIVSQMEENFCDAEVEHPSSPESATSSDSLSLQFISSTNSPEILPVHIESKQVSPVGKFTVNESESMEMVPASKPDETYTESGAYSVNEVHHGEIELEVTKSHAEDSAHTSKAIADITNLVSIECQQIKAGITDNGFIEEVAEKAKETTVLALTHVETSESSAAEMKSSDSLETVSGVGSELASTKTDPTSTYDLTSSQDTDFGSAENGFNTPEILPSLDSDSMDKTPQEILPADEKTEKSAELYSNEESALVSNTSSGVQYSEVQSCLVRTPKDGNTINVLGEEERPSRPKYLFLPSKITVENEQEASRNSETSQMSGTIGPGETPSAESRSSCAEATENLPLSSPDISESSSIEQGTASPPPTLAAATPLSDDTLSDLLSPEERSLGKLPPFWVPDAEAPNCMLCEVKFTVLKRRHHCRACGKVLCSKCCGLKARLEYMDNAEARICLHCHNILAKVMLAELEQGESASGSPSSPNENGTNSRTPLGRQPNPNNPMEYCSTIPPLEQAASVLRQPPPSVLVPVGVLKREGSTRSKGDVAKQVMFSDGIRPGGDLTELDGSGEPRLPYRRPGRVLKRVGTPPGPPSAGIACIAQRTFPPLDPKTQSYIPADKGLPPLAIITKGEIKFEDVVDYDKQMALLHSESEQPTVFAINRNLYVQVIIRDLDCCVNRTCWCFTSNGMSCVGQDEILIVLECLPDEAIVPRDILLHLNSLYQDASRGNTVSELGYTVLQGGSFLDSTEHGGFIYIRPSFQCLQKLALPSTPYLVAILFHRWETPWAQVFPIRLMLRLGAEYRYYPCMLVSVRNRKPVYWEIGHTIINLLADFRNLSYTLPSVRGLLIHMEDRQTSILLPKNRYDQVTRALNNSNDHVLALAANFSLLADSHLVCIQSNRDESYHTQAINIHNKPRKVTGASFVVFNGALKTSSNLTAKSSIVEDGLMVQITPDTMQALRGALRNMRDFNVGCGPAGATQPDELVTIKWVQDDRTFNIGVRSCIDGRSLDGVPSIRVHNGTDYMGSTRFIRWTEVFILQSDEDSGRSGDPLDISRLSESLARASCLALVKLLDLLAQAGLTKLAVRATIHSENVGYEAGSNGEKLPPIYMDSLDNELVPVLHKAASISADNTGAILELIFHIMLQ